MNGIVCVQMAQKNERHDNLPEGAIALGQQ
jgi:hypothetical protein